MKGQATVAMARGELGTLDRGYKEQARLFHFQARLTDGAGRILADGELEPAQWGSEIPDRIARRALSGESVLERAPHPATGAPMLVHAQTIDASGAVLRVATPQEPLLDLAGELTGTAVWVTALLLALSSLAAFLSFRITVRPLWDLAAAMRRLAARDFDVRLAPGNFKESAELAGHFNEMVSQFREVLRLLTGETERLGAILTWSQEAVVLVSEKGQILFANEPFKKSFPTCPKNGEAKPYWEGLRGTALAAVLERRLERPLSPEGETEGLEMEHGGRHFRGRLCPLPNQGAYLVTLHDVSGEMETARTKRELVANVSHELNTPLTSIKGFLETLEAGEGDGERKRLFAIVRRNTERLIAIVKDLLLLSNLDRGAQALQKERVRPLEILRAAVDLTRPGVAAKGLAFQVELPDELPALQADPFQIEQVLVNLLDNAVKYTDAGTIGLMSQASASGKDLLITVWDSGIGIPPGQEEKIFERFYTVDKSRSRKVGGTGLGLSIVKHIVLLHGGMIKVQRRIEGGTAFTISLPIA